MPTVSQTDTERFSIIPHFRYYFVSKLGLPSSSSSYMIGPHTYHKLFPHPGRTSSWIVHDVLMNGYLGQFKLNGSGHKIRNPYYMAYFHVSPSKLLTAAATLKTREANQDEFTAYIMIKTQCH